METIAFKPESSAAKFPVDKDVRNKVRSSNMSSAKLYKVYGVLRQIRTTFSVYDQSALEFFLRGLHLLSVKPILDALRLSTTPTLQYV